MSRLSIALPLVAALLLPGAARSAQPVDARHLFQLEHFSELATSPDAPVSWRAAALIRLGRMEEARSLAESTDAGNGSPLELVARAMVTAGEIGHGRTILDALLRQHPGDARLLARIAALESDAGRPVKAIAPLEKAVSLEPADLDYRRSLVQAWLDSGLPVRARKAFDAALAEGLKPDAALMAAGMNAMRAYGAHADAVDAGEAFLQDHPDAAEVLRLLALSQAALGAETRAGQTLKAYFGHSGMPDAETVALLKQVLPEAELAPVMADLRSRFPQQRLLFGPDAPMPRQLAWPWLAEAEVLAEQGNHPQARAILEQGLDAVTEGPEKALLLLRLAILEDEPAAALAHLDRAAVLDIPAGEVAATRFEVLSAAGQWNNAAQAAWEWSRLRPDDVTALQTLFRLEVAERLGWARSFARLHDYVQRDPDDPSRRLLALQRHAGTGGNALLALTHAQALERLVPGDDPRHKQGRQIAAKVANDLTGLGRITNMNAEAGHLSLITPQGTPITVTADPVTGRLIRYAEGRKWMQAQWSPDGLDLMGLRDSQGNVLSVEREKGRITRVSSRGRAVFQARLGKDGAPAEILSSLGESKAVAAYNNALAVLAAWPRTGIAGARWLRLVGG